MANESYRLRNLAFEWEKRAGSACETFHEYKGFRHCYECGQVEAQHAMRQLAKELRALLAEPEVLATR